MIKSYATVLSHNHAFGLRCTVSGRPWKQKNRNILEAVVSVVTKRLRVRSQLFTTAVLVYVVAFRGD